MLCRSTGGVTRLPRLLIPSPTDGGICLFRVMIARQHGIADSARDHGSAGVSTPQSSNGGKKYWRALISLGMVSAGKSEDHNTTVFAFSYSPLAAARSTSERGQDIHSDFYLRREFDRTGDRLKRCTRETRSSAAVSTRIFEQAGRRPDDCSAIPFPVLDRLVDGNHVDRKIAVGSRLVQPADKFARLNLGRESSRLEPPSRLTVIGVFDQPHDNRRLVVLYRCCTAIYHGSDYALKVNRSASSFAAHRSLRAEADPGFP